MVTRLKKGFSKEGEKYRNGRLSVNLRVLILSFSACEMRWPPLAE
jgi:hypothetical protein